MMRKRHYMWGAVAAVVALTLAGCSGNSDDSQTPDGAGTSGATDAGTAGAANDTVVVGLVSIIDVAPVYLGIEQGIYAAHGIDVEIQTGANGAALLPSVVSGEYNFAFADVVSTMLAFDQGIGVQMIAPSSASTGIEGDDYFGVLTREDTGITSAADLAGADVAMGSILNLNYVAVASAVRKANVDPADVNFIEMPFPDMVGALMEGRVDAIAVPEPFRTIGIAAGAIDINSAYAQTTPDMGVASFFTSTEYAAANPDIVERFAAATIEAQQYASEHPDEARAIVATYTTMDPAILEQVILPNWPSQMNAVSLQTVADLALDFGLVSKPVDINALFPGLGS
jgi:NitT/TauT family transport system substrate-binding protein